jgi:phage minor structural protein
MIMIYERGYEDFSTMGLGKLLPTSCVIHEEQGGAYELELEHPMDEDGRYALIVPGNVLKVPAPARTTPLVTAGGLADREIYTANEAVNLYSMATTSMGSTISSTTPTFDPTSIKPEVVRVRGYTDSGGSTVTKWVPNGNRIVGTAATGAELIAIDKTDPNYYLVATRTGKSGYVQTSKITYSKTETLEEQTIQAGKTREQLFRIYRIEKDTDNLSVKAWARHVYYDLLGNVLVSCAVDADTVGDSLSAMSLACTQTDHGFVFATDDTTTTITADWSRKGMVEAQLDPDEGIAALANLRVIRDNYVVFFVKRSTTVRAPITYGRTLLGVRVDINEDAVVNRIVPIGKAENGDPLLIDAVYVDSPNNDDATLLRAKTIEYDVQVGDDYPTEADAKTELTARANADFDAGIDQPEVTVNVDFLQMGDTEEYAQYKELDRLYLGDLIRVTDLVHGVDVEAEINEYDFDCLTEHYTSIVIGVTDSMRLIGSVSGFMIPDNAVSSTKIVGGVGNADTLDGYHAAYFATADHNHDSTYLKLTDVLSKTYPVGSIYMSNSSTSPATLFGGTWSAISSPPTGASYWWERTA